MDSSKTLKEKVERARKEVKELLAETRASQPNKNKLETGLKELQGNLEFIDVHLDSRDSK
jgi:hypothetical protein